MPGPCLRTLRRIARHTAARISQRVMPSRPAAPPGSWRSASPDVPEAGAQYGSSSPPTDWDNPKRALLFGHDP